MKALEIDLPYAERPPHQFGTPSAVLLLFGVSGEKVSLLLIKRAETVATHQGQMAFPGGVCELAELGRSHGEVQTALRETWEETGISSENIEILGSLPKIWTVTGFWITPIVAFLKVPTENIVLELNSAEIAEGIWIPLESLQDPSVYQREFRKFGEMDYPIHVFQINQYRIWGVTASMIRNLLDRLARP